ncbi:MAG: hypothetical protein Fur006_67110 [Coleofasciculaceae cyanobacterium]
MGEEQLMLTIWNFLRLLSSVIPGVIWLVSTSAIATEVRQRSTLYEVAFKELTFSPPASPASPAPPAFQSTTIERNSVLVLEQHSATAAKRTEDLAQSQAIETHRFAITNEQPEAMSEITSVSQLSDIQPTDWAFQALRSLVERYDCIAGYPDNTYRGDRVLTRDEFAAGLNTCLNAIAQQLGNLRSDASLEDIAALKRLQDEFAAELATLESQVENLEARADELETKQFSATTQLNTSLLLVSLVVNTALAALVNFLGEFLPGLAYLWQFLSFLVSFGMITLLFAAIYAILPDAQVAWRDAFVGAVITGGLFMLGQFLFGLFLSQTQFGSAYVVAGSFVIIITWIYYAAHILFLGAEFTKVYARRRGCPIIPEEHAVSISSNNQSHLHKARQENNSPGGKSKHNRSGKSSSNQQISYHKWRNSGNLLTQLSRRWSSWRNRKR